MDTSTNMPMTAAVIASTQTQTNPQNIPPVPPSKPNRSLQFFLLLFVFILGTGVGSLLLLKAQQGSTNNGDQLTPTPTPTKAQAKLTETKRWLNLSDIRQVVEDGNKLYLAVMGGVAVVDKDSGKVLDQITMADGMRNYTTTSMVKKGNTLYVGTQDGFSVINLDTRGIKNISEQEGLVNGANILVKEDGDNIWVGTFRGVSVYNTKTGELKNYQSEFDNGSVPFNAVDLLVTPKAVFAMNASGTNAGTVMSRFDKATQRWTNFKGSDFSSEPYITLLSMYYAGREVWVTDHKTFWHISDTADAKWFADETLGTEAKKQGTNVYYNLVGGDINTLYLYGNNILWKYNLANKSFESEYPPRLFTEFDSIFANASLIGKETSDHKWWVRRTDGFIGYYDSTSKDAKTLELADRPVTAGGVVAVIDHKPIVKTENGLWQYDPTSGFKKLFNYNDKFGMVVTWLWPVENTSQMIAYTQLCGQGCEEPKMFIYDYLAGTTKNIEIDNQVLKSIRAGTISQSYQELHFDSLDGHIASLSAQYPTPFIANFDLDNSIWTVTKTTAKKVQENLMIEPVTCNALYTFENSGQKFAKEPCKTDEYWGQLVENGKTRFYLYKPEGKVEMYPQLAAAEYSPFSVNPGLYNVRQVTKIGDELWVGTDRGLAIYNFTDNKWRLISTRNGLTANKIDTFVVDGDTLWSFENWAGLSGVVLK